jgi:hypothetical protein
MTESLIRESSKFRVLSAPVQKPGVCAGCGSSGTEDRQYVDLDVTVDFHGVIYLCTFCFSECANALGFLNPKQSSVLEHDLTIAEQTIIDFRVKEQALDNAINALRDSGVLSHYPDPSISTPTKPVQDRIIGATGNDKESEQFDPESELINSKQGSSDLSDSSVDELFDGPEFKL